MTEPTKTIFMKTTSIVIQIGILLFCIALAWGTLKTRVDTNSRDIIETKERVQICEKNVVQIDKTLTVIDTRQQQVLKGIDEIKEKIK